jgi:sugar phosphate permease
VTSKPRNLLFIFVLLSALYLLSQFYRVSNAVIAPDLIKDLGLNAETLGILGGAFFYCFALLQIPMGPMLDRIGPSKVVSYSVLVSALGAFLFGMGESFATVLIGRILVGVGMASVLVGAMKVFVLHFPPRRFATLVGTIVAVGTLGNILAASPLAYFSSRIGWRLTFIIVGGITALLAFLSLWVLGGKGGGDEKPHPAPSAKQELGILRQMGMILGSLSFWQIGFLALFRFGTFIGLQGLWLGPYLIQIKGYSAVEAGNMLILVALGSIIGGPIAGRLSDQVFQSRKWVALVGLSLYSLSLFPLTGILKVQSSMWLCLVLFAIGLFTNCGLLLFSHAKDLFPASISGTVTSFVNFFTMTGAAVFMPLLGKVIESFPRTGNSFPAEAYHAAFLICFLGMTAGLIFYAFSQNEIQKKKVEISKMKW